MKNIHLTSVWCYAKSPEEAERDKNLGIESPGDDDIWMPFAVDFDKVVAIKQAAYTDFLGDNRTTVYLDGEHLTINLDFDEALAIWRK